MYVESASTSSDPPVYVWGGNLRRDLPLKSRRFCNTSCSPLFWEEIGSSNSSIGGVYRLCAAVYGYARAIFVPARYVFKGAVVSSGERRGAETGVAARDGADRGMTRSFKDTRRSHVVWLAYPAVCFVVSRFL